MKTVITRDEWWEVSFPLTLYRQFITDYNSELRKSFEKIDLDRNGIIEGSEIYTLAFKYGEDLYGKEYHFKKIADKNGILKDDLKLALPENKALLRKVTLKIKKDFDINNDKKISFEEFKKVILKVSTNLILQEKKDFDLKKYIELLKKYTQAVKEFKDNVSIDDIKNDTTNVSKSIVFETVNKTVAAIGESAKFSCFNIIRHLLEVLENNFKLLFNVPEDFEKECTKFYDKHFGKIPKYFDFLEKMLLFLEKVEV